MKISFKIANNHGDVGILSVKVDNSVEDGYHTVWVDSKIEKFPSEDIAKWMDVYVAPVYPEVTMNEDTLEKTIESFGHYNIHIKESKWTE